MARLNLQFPNEMPMVSAERRVAWGGMALQKGRPEAALAIADAVLAELPKLASAWLLRGTACSALRRFPEAADAFRFLLGMFPDFTEVQVNLANICMELGDLDAARTQLLDVIARAPTYAAAHASLGSLHMRMGRYDLAETPVREALALDPAIVTAHQNLAAILALRDDAEAQVHRDMVYRRQQIFIERSAGAKRTVLILTSSGAGNVPYQHLLPRAQYNRILWHIDYAPPGQHKKLPAYDFVFNAIADPDAAPEAQKAAQRFIRSCTKPVFNNPARVAQTLRPVMPARFKSIRDVVMPRTEHFTGRDGTPKDAVAARDFAFPAILRPIGRHGGEGTKLIRAADELSSGFPSTEAFYATEFVNYRSADGWYRKYRVIFVDREPYPYHLAIGSRWLLHYRTADMQADAARRAEEAAFLRDQAGTLGARAMAALVAIGKRLDLDYAGIDFSLLPDGRILFFEANATMLVHPEDDPLFVYKNQAVSTILMAVDGMIARQTAGRARPSSARPGTRAPSRLISLAETG
jgi:tetratricopeptide (TPR) repeat protein